MRFIFLLFTLLFCPGVSAGTLGNSNAGVDRRGYNYSLAAVNSSPVKKKKVLLHIQTDRSPSVKIKLPLITQAFVEAVTKTLDVYKKCLEYKVSVGNMMYRDVARERDLRPYHHVDQPMFLTRDTPNAAELLEKRIVDPVGAMGADSKRGKILAGWEPTKEVLFSGVAEAFLSFKDEIKGQDVVASLLVSDAVPNYETYNPAGAYNTIKSLIGEAEFTASIIGFHYRKHDHWYPTMQNGEQCNADRNGLSSGERAQINQNFIGIDKLYEFVEMSDGSMWDICEPSEFDIAIQTFIIQVLEKAQCLDIV